MSKLEKLFRTDTLRGRLRIFILNLILFVVLIVSGFLIYITKEQIKLKSISELNSIVKMQKITIEKWFNEREIDLRTIASAKDVVNINPVNTKEYFENFINNQSEFYYLSLLDLNGKTLIDTTIESKRDFKNQNFFIEAKEGLTSISKASIDSTGNIPAIHFATPIFKNGKVTAVLTAGVRLSNLQIIVEGFRFGKSGDTFIIDSKNRLLTSRRFDTQDKLLSTYIYKGVKEGFYTSYHNQEVLGGYAEANFGNWKIVAEISKTELYELFKQFLLAITIFLVVFFIILIPIVLSFSNKLERPIQHLVDGSKKIEDGEYGHIINSQEISYATNEIKDLTSSFNSMSSVLDRVFKELMHKSSIDLLTGVFNRRELMKRCEEAYINAQDSETPFSIFMIDIDHFKNINDTYGHQCGDYVISTVADTIKTSLSNKDIIGRYGGEEFLVAITHESKQRVIEIAERVRKNVEDLNLEFERESFRCTCSIGVFHSNYIQAFENLEKAIEKADQNLYEAKRGGRNRIII